MLIDSLRELASDLRYRLRALFRREALERELDDELRFHLERETEKLVRSGISPAEATRQARLAFGGVDQTKEESRDARGLAWLDAFTQDLRWAARSLRRTPGFTAAVVLTITLGLGANAALFGIIDRLMFRPPAYLRDPAQVNRVYLYSLFLGRRDIPVRYVSHARYANIERATHSFDRVAGFLFGTVAVGTGTEARETVVSAVTASYFDFFNARPVQGRFITTGDGGGPTGAPVVVLSYSYWRDQFGARTDAVGASIQVDSVIRTVIGVAPEGFVGIMDGPAPALWIPTSSRSRMTMVVRRKPGVSEAAASADLSLAFVNSYEAERAIDPHMPPIDVARPSAAVVSLHEMRRPNAPSEAKLFPWVGGVGLIVLLIACANVANLQLARALRRRREMAVRLALGISRGRLFFQLLTESLLLAVPGGVGGLLVAHWGAAVLRALLAPQTVYALTLPVGAAARDGDVAVMTDGRTLLFVSCSALVVGILSGLAPALHALRQDVAGGLKSGAREGSYQRSRTRSALLVSQVALSAALLVGAGLFVRSLVHVRALRLGYDVDPILTAHLDMRGTTLDDSTHAVLLRRLEAEVTTIPGVAHATRSTIFAGFIESQQLFVPGAKALEGQFLTHAVGPEYFATAGTRVLRGRAFAATDRADAPLVTIVSQAMAQALWPGQEAIGRCIGVGFGMQGVTPVGVYVGAETAPCRTVVGIAEDIKETSFVDDPGLQYYLPTEQWHPHEEDLIVRVDGNASRYAETIRGRLQRLMPGNSRVTVTPLREILAPKMRPWRLGATLFLAFGGLALVVAAVGLFAVISYNVEQRSHELGVRIAFGAESADVLGLVVGQAMRFALVGIAIGSAIAVGAGRWMRPLLFAESPGDPVVYVAVAAVLSTVALVASAFPARHATRVDPMIALRGD